MPARARMQVSSRTSRRTCSSPGAQRVQAVIGGGPIGRRWLPSSPRNPRLRTRRRKHSSWNESRTRATHATALAPGFHSGQKRDTRATEPSGVLSFRGRGSERRRTRPAGSPPEGEPGRDRRALLLCSDHYQDRCKQPVFQAVAIRARQGAGPAGVEYRGGSEAGLRRRAAVGEPRGLSQARRRTLGAAARFAARPDLLTGFQASA